ncbi:O-antigen ligase family protein [Latilactobacillus sakei]|uniref:O-antigen ligase family protein n=1 Tax=Latilactobacillus sakei TaxID=1599 RepID=UPI00232EBD28|nr:O-antigen ligase family protein [Latilactobacillus sakei]MDB1553432.1 hypothetical protein [Latilactobacillus sakei]
MEDEKNYKGYIFSVSIIFSLSILNVYNHLTWAPYLTVLSMLAVVIYNYIQEDVISSEKVGIFRFTLFLIVIIVTLFNMTRGHLSVGIISYFTVIVAILMFHRLIDLYGNKFYEEVWGCLSLAINVLGVFNIYQIIYKRPMLYDFLNTAIKSYQFVGMDYYRTSSIFGSAIPACQIFVIGFFLNIFIKRKINFLINIILLVDIYSTQSRSGWISLAVALVIYALIRMKKINLKSISFNIFQFLFFGFISLGSTILVAINIKAISMNIISRFGDSLSWQNSTDVSNLQRVETIESIFNRMFTGSRFSLLFGNGVGSSKDFMKSNKIIISNFDTTDNQILSLFFDLGTVVTLILLVVLIIFFIKSIKNQKVAESFILLSIMVVGLFFYEGFNWPIISVLFSLFFVGCSYNVAILDKEIEFNE